MVGKTVQTVKHREVEESLRSQIEAGAWGPGDRLPGEYELAKQYDVAYTTMRQAITNLVGDGLLNRIRGKGTYIVERIGDRRLKTRHPMSLVIPSSAQASDSYYYPEVVMSFQQEVAQAGFQTSLQDYNSVERPYVLEPSSAVACLLVHPGDIELVERLRDAGHRVLAINHYSGRRSIPCVRIDDAAGVEQAVDHLVSIGHSRIGFIRGLLDNLDAADRLQGFRNAVRRHELRNVYEAGDGFAESCGYSAMKDLLSFPNRPTAVVCASDLAAIGAILAAQEAGLSVPRALSVIGFGNFSVVDYIMPRLTTVRQSRTALGRTSAQALIALANGQDVAGEVLSAELIVRDSTQSPGP